MFRPIDYTELSAVHRREKGRETGKPMTRTMRAPGMLQGAAALFLAWKRVAPPDPLWTGIPTSGPSPRSQRGVVLVLTLIVLAVVSSLALHAQLATRAAYQEEAARWQAFRLRQAAAEGLRGGLERLAADEDLRVDHGDEEWSEPLEWENPDGIQVRIDIVDENRFFDLNNLAVPDRPSVRSPRSIVSDLLTLCGEARARERADLLADWLDADDTGAGEDRRYEDRRPPIPTPDRVALSWSELEWVDDFAPVLAALPADSEEGPAPPPRLQQVATVVPLGRESILPVNVNTAGEATLQGVLGLNNPSLLVAVLRERERGPIRGFDMAGLAIDPDLIQQLGPYLSVQSTVFRLTAEAADGNHRQRVIAVVQRDEQGNLAMLRWAH